MGRPAPAAPTVFKSNPTDYSPAIAALILNDEAQDTLITGLTNDAVGLSGEIAILAANTDAALVTKLEAPAIADFEPTASLNARDTANRARANHTGTQPAVTVTGLATVATSGAYSDLSGTHAISYGFTYDQQAEPSSPPQGRPGANVAPVG
ncbi:hypothetical protein VB780_14080 [Leptolyngbya sp. CCNP1308]|uniref:hypothetical protein n=1 Tax=Leptolyngbya sp. CCNP1308 TaxID=3110255 RepID=UPI002B1F6FFF|nr:hypothetical protein [Leptolyngbya sp. CCNP1308]MEA5449708.1 hypothetical protein [Leptolyngbya sp. CCNP1308]